MSAKDMDGHFVRGWGGFYDAKEDLGRPHLRTYHGPQSEKFYETFKVPLAPARPAKGFVPPAPPSLTWGVGGTLPTGKMYLPVPAAGDFKESKKKFLLPRASEEAPVGADWGRKGKVYDASGNDAALKKGTSFTLEDSLQRKAKVPEENRTDSRTIHRIAPPGLKGYMGAEYSNDFFTTGRDYGFVSAPVSQKATRKTFAQKRAEDEIAEQVALVGRLALPLEEGLDSDAEEEYAEAEKAYAD